MKPLFTLIVPFHNEGRKIEALLDSLARIDTNSPSHEVVFVDNRSDDDGPQFVRQRGFHVEAAPDVASSYYARNIGASCARGDYLVFVDADCVVDRNLFLGYAAHIAKALRPACTVFAGEIRPFRQGDGNIYERYAARRRILNQKSAITGWSYRNFAQTANAMYSRDAFLSVGGFHASMTTGGDAEICWRFSDMLQADYCYAETAIVYHQHRTDLTSLAAQYRKYGAGRIQQVLASRRFAEEREESFVLPVERVSGLCERLEQAGFPDDAIFDLIDYFRESAYSHGRLEELVRQAAGLAHQPPLIALRKILTELP